MSMATLTAVLMVAGACFFTPTDARYTKRSEDVHLCSRSTPCGWVVYRPYVRTVEYFISSPCECPAGTTCIRTGDNIAISAYVYRCRTDAENTARQGRLMDST